VGVAVNKQDGLYNGKQRKEKKAGGSLGKLGAGEETRVNTRPKPL